MSKKKKHRTGEVDSARARQAPRPAAAPAAEAIARQSSDSAPRAGTGRRLLIFAAVLSVPALYFLIQSSVRDGSSPGAPRGIEKTASDSGATKAELPTTIATAPQMKDDPKADGWDTEVFNDQAGGQLKKIAGLLADPAALEKEQPSSLAVDRFSCDPLRPEGMKEAFADRCVSVARGAAADETIRNEVRGRHEGPAGFRQALRDLAKPFAGMEDVHAKFKLFNVEPNERDRSILTRQYFSISGREKARAAGESASSLEQNATWVARWAPPEGNAPPRLVWIGVTDCEESRAQSPSETLFSDCTRAVLGANESFEKQIRYGAEHWLSRTDSLLNSDILGLHGVTVGDVNGDGLDDVYLLQSGGLPNRLYVQNPDGTATDRSAEAGVDWLETSRSALLVDLDNDGDEDFVIATLGALLIMSNDGRGRFTLEQRLAEVAGAYSLAAADIDSDGDLDIYACVYSSLSNPYEGKAPIPIYDATNGEPDFLLRNDGSFRFTDATKEVGLDHNNDRWGYAASFEDYDNDGDPDLYVANDFGRKNLYRNDGGHFHDVAKEAGVEDQSFGMSVTWADMNHDGLMDLYTSNMFSSAGNRITFQPKFKPEASEDTRAKIQYAARGNTLFVNNGDGTFRDASIEANVTMGRWAWGSKFVDINNDTWDDIVVANGFVTGEDPKDL